MYKANRNGSWFVRIVIAATFQFDTPEALPLPRPHLSLALPLEVQEGNVSIYFLRDSNCYTDLEIPTEVRSA